MVDRVSWPSDIEQLIYGGLIIIIGEKKTQAICTFGKVFNGPLNPALDEKKLFHVIYTVCKALPYILEYQ